MSTPVIPGIAIAALDAIQDQNAQTVLRSIVDGWAVRNGDAGNGKNRFITAGELGEVNGHRLIGGLGTAIQSQQESEGRRLGPGDISRLINDLQASVIESQLFKELGERIELIDDSVVREQLARIAAVQQVANNLAAEAATRLGFDTVQGSAINSLQSVTNTQATLISGLTTRVSGSESTIITLQNTTATQATQLNNLTTRVGSSESNITSLQTTTSTQATSLNSLSTRVGGAESNISTLNTTTSNQANSLTALSTRVGNAETAVTNESTTRANSDNAMAGAIGTVWAAIGNGSALVQQGSNGYVNNAGAVATQWNQTQTALRDANGNLISSSAVRQTADTAVNKAGALEGKYTVKIDVNGYVSGFGLASTANNATPFSEFIVRADRFAIGTPSAPDWAQYVNNYGDLLSSWYNAGQPDKEIFGYNHYINQGAAEGRTVPNKLEEVIPFIVTTTPQTVNGKTAPPGVYIDSAFIKNGTITTANIGLAQVDTLLIQGNAVTVPFFAQSSVITTNATTTTAQAISGSYTLEAGSLVMAIATGTGNKVGSFFGIAVAIYLYNVNTGAQTLIGYAGASFENFATITGQGSSLITTTGPYRIEAIVYRTDGTPTIPDMTDVQVKVSAFGGRR